MKESDTVVFLFTDYLLMLLRSFRAECDQRMKQDMNPEGLSSVAGGCTLKSLFESI